MNTYAEHTNTPYMSIGNDKDADLHLLKDDSLSHGGSSQGKSLHGGNTV
jgi:hypothetical protein